MGRDDPILIEIPKGGYTVHIQERAQNPAAPAPLRRRGPVGMPRLALILLGALAIATAATVVSKKMGSRDAPPFEEPRDAAGDASRDPGHLGIAGRRQSPESKPLPIVQIVDSVEHQAVKVDVEVNRAPGIGAIAGTVVGAIAGGVKGAAIGAVAGGGGAAMYQVFTRGKRPRQSLSGPLPR